MSQVGPPSDEVVAPPPRLVQVRLSRRQQLELVERYRGGALRRELAEAYGIGTGTVSGILKRHDASRKIGLSEDEVEEAAESYEAGQSLAQIGEALGVVAGTVRTALLRRGVAMRSTAPLRHRSDPLC
ncbi:hypothetical protein GCM10028772_15110 [Nocardioides ultimimeridianus]